MADPEPDMSLEDYMVEREAEARASTEEFKRGLPWLVVPLAIIILVINAIKARYPLIDAGLVSAATSALVIAVTYPLAVWWGKKHAKRP